MQANNAYYFMKLFEKISIFIALYLIFIKRFKNAKVAKIIARYHYEF